MAVVLGIGTAVPIHRAGQDEIRELVGVLFQRGFRDIDRLLSLFEHAQIQQRYLAQPLGWYAGVHTFSETNGLYAAVGLPLIRQAAGQAIAEAGIDASEIGAVVFVSSTGIATPTLDAELIQLLDLPRTAVRLPIWGLGCAGGVSGLARAMEMVNARPRRKVLLIALELCSLTFQIDDLSKSNLVGTGIFGDGAAAVVIGDDGPGPELCGAFSTLFDNTQDVMGWDVVESGLKVRFARDIPAIVREKLPALLAHSCTTWGISSDAVRHFVVHPGGAKVIDAYEESLALPSDRFAAARKVLAEYGNMSSASILFVLKQYLAAVPQSGSWGIMLSLGPGFSAEQLLFRW